MIRVGCHPFLLVVSRENFATDFHFVDDHKVILSTSQPPLCLGHTVFHSGNHSSKGNITHVLPSNLHCKYAWMQSAHETMDIAPYQSVKLSAAIAVGVVAVSFSEKKTWSPIWFVILSPRYTIRPLYWWYSSGISWCFIPASVKTSATLTFSPSLALGFNRWIGMTVVSSNVPFDRGPKASFSTALTAVSFFQPLSLWQVLCDKCWHWAEMRNIGEPFLWIPRLENDWHKLLCIKSGIVLFGCLRRAHVRVNHRIDIQQMLWESVYHRTKRTKASWWVCFHHEHPTYNHGSIFV